MKKKIQGIHLELTDTLKDKINKEINEFQIFISQHVSNINISVDLSVDKLDQICHIKLVAGPKTFNVTKKHEDMYVSIDNAFKTLKITYAKYQHKIQSKKRRGESIRDMHEEDLVKEEEEILNEEE